MDLHGVLYIKLLLCPVKYIQFTCLKALHLISDLVLPTCSLVTASMNY